MIPVRIQGGRRVCVDPCHDCDEGHGWQCLSWGSRVRSLSCPLFFLAFAQLGAKYMHIARGFHSYFCAVLSACDNMYFDIFANKKCFILACDSGIMRGLYLYPYATTFTKPKDTHYNIFPDKNRLSGSSL